MLLKNGPFTLLHVERFFFIVVSSVDLIHTVSENTRTPVDNNNIVIYIERYITLTYNIIVCVLIVLYINNTFKYN